MFRRNAHDVSNMAADRWQELVDNLGSTEAGHRVSRAWDVLSGRPAHGPAYARTRPVLRAAVVGIALGWAASEIYRRRKPEIDQAISRVGAQLHEARTTIDDKVAVARATPGGPFDKAKAAVGINASSIG